MYFYLYCSAPGLVQSLFVSSVNATSITIQWDRVDCQERNGHITDFYRVVYHPISNPQDFFVAWIFARMLIVTGLLPRTNYTFRVHASNPNIDMRGPPAFYTASTTALQGMEIE